MIQEIDCNSYCKVFLSLLLYKMRYELFSGLACQPLKKQFLGFSSKQLFKENDKREIMWLCLPFRKAVERAFHLY